MTAPHEPAASEAEPAAPRYRKAAIPNAVRREVCRRYGAEPGMRIDVQCAYCDHVGFIDWWAHYPLWPTLSLEFDHVIAEVLGGPTTADNLVLACRRCNRQKSTKSLDAAGGWVA